MIALSYSILVGLTVIIVAVLSYRDIKNGKN
jgi:hypothetical protein